MAAGCVQRVFVGLQPFTEVAARLEQCDRVERQLPGMFHEAGGGGLPYRGHDRRAFVLEPVQRITEQALDGMVRQPPPARCTALDEEIAAILTAVRLFSEKEQCPQPPFQDRPARSWPFVDQPFPGEGPDEVMESVTYLAGTGAWLYIQQVGVGQLLEHILGRRHRHL